MIVANSLIGTVQELRARAALDRLAVLNTPRATVVRDGAEAEVDLEGSWPTTCWCSLPARRWWWTARWSGPAAWS